MAKENRKASSILEKLESNELLLALAFGAALVFMGFMFLPIGYNPIGRIGVSLVYLSLGVIVMVFSLRKISDNPWFSLARNILYIIFGVCFATGSFFLLIFAISKIAGIFTT